MQTTKVHIISGQYKYDHTTAYLMLLDRLINDADTSLSVADLSALRQDYALHTRHFVKRATQGEVYNAI